jgi:hypothetical protein
MGHQIETPHDPTEVRKPPYLLQRGNRWFFRIKIPADLRRAKVYKESKDIKIALKMSDIREARQRAGVKYVLWNDAFEQQREKLRLEDVARQQRRRQAVDPNNDSPLREVAIHIPAPKRVSVFSDAQLREIIVRHFTELEIQSNRWFRDTLPALRPEERQDPPRIS